MKLHQAILAVMQEVKYLKNDKSVSGQYKAISDGKVRTVLQTVMHKHGLTIFTRGISTSTNIERWQDGPKWKQQVLVEAHVQYTVTHAESGESIDIESFGIGIDAQDKSPGKAMTYALKYALLNLFLIPTGDDSDQVHSDEIEVAGKPAKEELKPGHSKWAKALENIKAGNVSIEAIEKKYFLSDDTKKLLTDA